MWRRIARARSSTRIGLLIRRPSRDWRTRATMITGNPIGRAPRRQPPPTPPLAARMVYLEGTLSRRYGHPAAARLPADHAGRGDPLAAEDRRLPVLAARQPFVAL